MTTVRAASVEETHAFAGRLARALAAAIQNGELETVLVGLRGDLGAGKTELVRGFVAGLDPSRAAQVTSPTYAILQTYEGAGGVPEIRHVDLYRLGSAADLDAIGYRDLCFAPGITLVEWIDSIPAAIPAEWIEIALAVDPSDVREIRALPHGERLMKVLSGVRA